MLLSTVPRIGTLTGAINWRSCGTPQLLHCWSRQARNVERRSQAASQVPLRAGESKSVKTPQPAAVAQTGQRFGDGGLS